MSDINLSCRCNCSPCPSYSGFRCPRPAAAARGDLRCRDCADGHVLLYREPVTDDVTHPSHYTFGKFEVTDVLLDWFPDDPLAFIAVQYLARYRRKGQPVKDLQKAEWYLKRLISEEKKKAGTA